MSELEKIYIPPMAGVTDLVFRKLIREIVGEYSDQLRLSTEMISSKGIMYQENPRRMELEEEEIGKVIIQLFGHEPDTMAFAAQIAEKSGAAGIDINMGCPVPKITNGKDGAALMKEPCLAEGIVRSVKEAVDIPVSVKTRLGWNEEQKNIKEFALRLQDAGISSITIHGRTRKQSYTGVADWDAIREVRELLDIPVFANGDIDTPEKALEALHTTGSHGVAVARGVIGNPWLARNIIKYMNNSDDELDMPDNIHKIIVLEQHIDWAHQYMGVKGIQSIKKHIGKYISGFPEASKWRLKLATSQTYPVMKDSLSEMKDSICSLVG